MRTKHLFISMLALAAVGFASCSDDKTEPNNGKPGNKQVAVSISTASDITRTVIEGDRENGFKTRWEVGNTMGVYTSGGSVANTNQIFKIESGGISNGLATFSGTFEGGTEGDITVYGYYPWDGNAGSDKQAVTMTVPPMQTMNGDSYDPTADLMVALAQPVNVAGQNATISDFRFKYLVAFTHLNVRLNEGDPHNIDVSADEVVETVMFEAGENIAISGQFTTDLTTGTANYPAQPVNIGTDNTVRVAVPAGTTLGDFSAWIVTLPFELTATDALTIRIETASHIIEKTISATALEFGVSKVRTIDMRIDEDCTITVKNLESAEAPDQAYIIGDATEFETGKAMRKVNANVFEIYTQLKAGRYGFTDSATGETKYMAVDGELYSGSNQSLAEAGEYYIKLDFAEQTVNVEKIESVKWKHSWEGTTADLVYAGNGKWAVTGVLTTPNGNNDDRYRFTVMQGGKEYIWGASTKDVSAPDNNTAASYWDVSVRERGNIDSFDYSFKFMGSQKNALMDYVVDMSPEMTIYHHTATATPITITPGVPATPQNNLNLDLNDGNTSLAFSWSAGSSSDEIAPTYAVAFYATASSTEELKHVSSGGGATNVDISYADINSAAEAAGIGMGGTGNIYWTVFTQRGTQEVAATSRHAINVTRIQGISNIPTQVYLTGAASEFTSSERALRKKSTNVFDIVTKLSPGEYAFTNGSGDGMKYAVRGSAIYEGNANITDTRDGIYRITLDFNASTIKYEKITDVSHFMCGNQKYTPMTYTGDGAWELQGFQVSFDVGWGNDNRFHYRFKVDDGEKWHKWGSNYWDGRGFEYPNPQDREFFEEWMEGEHERDWQYDYSWKYLNEHRDKKINIRITTWPDAGRTNYTQVITFAQ